MKHSSLRRSGALLVAATVSAAGWAIGPIPASAAEPAPNGATWLAAQLGDDHLLHYLNFGFMTTDHGLSIDAAFALDAVGGREGEVAAIAAAVADQAGVYTQDDSYDAPEDWNDPESPTHHYEGHRSNAIAKALALLAKTEPADSAVRADLVQRLEAVTLNTGLSAGRISDLPTRDGQPYPAGDYANTFGQSFAVRALDAVGSPEAGAATGFLLEQRCVAGYFRLLMAPSDTTTPSCDAGAGRPSVDATALAVLALLERADDAPAVATALAGTVDWLVGSQAADGSFADDGAANTNSTGLAAWALGSYALAEGDDAALGAAEKAAGWVRRHQAVNVGACLSYAATAAGAVAYDSDALAAGARSGITAESQGVWLRATAQALPALQWAPDAVDALHVSGPRGYVRAGSRQVLPMRGLASGETACLSGPGARATVVGAPNGTGAASVVLPRGTGTRTYTLTTAAGAQRATTVKSLDGKRLPFSQRKRVARRDKQVVRVRGLAPREKVLVRMGGKKVGAGRANARGRFVTRFRVRRPAGRAKVVVTGQFPDRRNAKTFRVVR